MQSRRRITKDPGERVAPLVRAMLWRRSVRAYTDEPISEEALDQVSTAARTALSVEQRRSGQILLFREPDQVDGLTEAITSGFMGKTNIWLRRTSARAYLVAVGRPSISPCQDDRCFYNVDVALAGQACVLVAAAHHVGTCWMAAIGEKGVQSFLKLPPTDRVAACIPMGMPRLPGQRGWGLASMWDTMANRLISSRRKPLSEIHFLESFSSKEKLPPADLMALPYDRLELVDLACSLRPSLYVGGGVLSETELGWMMEACRQAPSADNSQIGRYVVIREPKRIRSVLEAASSHPHEDLTCLTESDPGCVIVLAAAPFIIKHRTAEQPFFLIDVPIALYHLLLMASHLRLSWNALFRFHQEAVGRIVDLPSRHKVVALLLLGRKEKTKAVGRTDASWVQLGTTSDEEG